MKRVITVTGEDHIASVSIRIAVGTKGLAQLTRDELAAATEQLADEAMRAIANVRYVGIPLSRQRVR